MASRSSLLKITPEKGVLRIACAVAYGVVEVWPLEYEGHAFWRYIDATSWRGARNEENLLGFDKGPVLLNDRRRLLTHELPRPPEDQLHLLLEDVRVAEYPAIDLTGLHRYELADPVECQ